MTTVDLIIIIISALTLLLTTVNALCVLWDLIQKLGHKLDIGILFLTERTEINGSKKIETKPQLYISNLKAKPCCILEVKAFLPNDKKGIILCPGINNYKQAPFYIQPYQGVFLDAHFINAHNTLQAAQKGSIQVIVSTTEGRVKTTLRFPKKPLSEKAKQDTTETKNPA